MAKHLCPVWIGYLLASPIRKLFQNPDKMLRGYIEENMTVLDVGCAMGFFSIPAAKMAGANGKIICIDVQKKMLKVLEKRASKRGLINRIETRLCDENSLGLNDIPERIDFAFAVAVVHEVRDSWFFFAEILKALKPGHKFLVVEPKGHVSAEEFEKTISIAKENGFIVIDRAQARSGRIAVLKK
jgi:ubiquinone/menaquinone biosynthesis C-methylase UbiE